MPLDIRTLILLNFITNLINAGAIAVVWRQNRGRFAGISLWLVNMLFHAAGTGLILLRGVLPDFFTIVLSNTLMLSGALLILIGLEQFTDKRSRQIHNYALLAFYAFLMVYSLYYQPDMTRREIWTSGLIVIIDLQTCWLLLGRVDLEQRPETRYTGWIMGGYAAVSLARLTLLAVFPLNTSDFFQSGLVDGLAITATITLNVCMTISLIIMVNTQLIEAVRAQEEKFTKAFHSSPFAIIFLNLSNGKIFEVNDGFVKLTGFSSEEAVGKTTYDLNLWVRRKDGRKILRDTLRNQRIHGREIQIRKKSGILMTGLLTIDVILLNNQKCILASIGDVTELSQMKHKLQELATHDTLTGLANRALFYDRVEFALANARRNKKMTAVMTLDLDKFKGINDAFGHATGDLVLVETAKRLTGSVRAVDTVARYGGDEFVVLLWEINHSADSIEVIERILQSIRQPFYFEGQELSLSVSIGVATFPENGDNIEDLIKRSDESLYQVKESGGDNYQLSG